MRDIYVFTAFASEYSLYFEYQRVSADIEEVVVKR